MSARLALFFALLVMGMSHSGLSADTGKETFAPETYNISRYEQIWKRSPFIVETVATVDSPGLATKFSLVGLVSSGSDAIAFLIDRNEPDPVKNHFQISKNQPDKVRNLELVSITSDQDIRKSSVLIRQGSEQATLPFAAEVLSSMSSGTQSGNASPGGYIPPSRNPMAIPSTGMIPHRPRDQMNPSNPSAPSPLPPNGLGSQEPPTPTRRIIRPKPINVN